MRAVSPLPAADSRPPEPHSDKAATLRNILHGFADHDSAVERRKEFSRKGPAFGQDQGTLVDW